MKKMMKKRWFIFCDDQLVVKKTGETVYSIPEYDDTPCPLSGDDIMIDVADISGEGTVMAAMVRDKDRMAERTLSSTRCLTPSSPPKRQQKHREWDYISQEK